MVEVFFNPTCSGLLVPSTRCLSSSPSPLTLKSATITGPDGPDPMVVTNVAELLAGFGSVCVADVVAVFVKLSVVVGVTLYVIVELAPLASVPIAQKTVYCPVPTLSCISQLGPEIVRGCRKFGTGSLMVTPVAVAGPLFVTVIVYATFPPGATVLGPVSVIARSASAPETDVNVAVTVSGPAGMLNVHVEVPTVHAIGAPLHPPNPPPDGGVSVKVTAVLYGVFTEQLAIPAAGPQLMPPPVTVPPAVPARFTVNR